VVSVPDLVGRLSAIKKLAADRGHADASEVMLAIDADTPAVVTKSVVHSAALAGFGHVSFLVKKER
jgi:hypothetical protein